jgi:competence protein ComEC
MPLASLGFLVGVLICQSLTELPMREWSFLIIVLIPLVLRVPEFRLPIFILLGFLYSVFIAHSKLATQFSPEMDGRDFLVSGTVSAITSKSAQHTRFWLNVSGLSEFPGYKNTEPGIYQGTKKPPQRIQLTWYKGAPTISVGQQWRLKVRLKHPRGFSNPGAFDYEGWLYQQGIDATGYVRSGKENDNVTKLLGVESGPLIWIERLRATLSHQIATALKDKNHASLITALVVGDRQSMTDEQWSTLTRTGTNHLMAISGLHIGLIAGLFFFLINRAWRLIPRASLKVPAPRIAAITAIMAALIYAALAGFTLPTQRAFIMISVAMLALWLQRPVASSQVLATALLAVLIYDPSSVMNGSFWLSFAAVVVIVFTLSNRLPMQTKAQKWWWKWGRIQWVITIGLAPILLFWFQQVPAGSPIANFIAVPWVSLITVPLSLLGGALVLVAPMAGEFILLLADFSLALLWPVLESMAAVDELIYKGSQPPLWTLLPALIGIGLLLAPKGFPARWLGVVWLLPLVFYPRSDIAHGAYRLTLLDVGHGLATVVRTRNHVLVYDVGPRYSDTFNAGDVAVLPFLKTVGIYQIDRVILSHDDIDHTGGFEAINANLKINRLTLGPGVSKSHALMDYCQRGQQWDWDGVQFKVLHPPGDYKSRTDNNNSCVVQITTENDKLLLTGDIEREVETQFVKFFAGDDDNLRADVLLVPHHGSLSSSSDAFLRAIQPDYALISAGYNNRYGLPKPQVVARYQAMGTKILNTGQEGAISFLMDQRGLSELTLHRHQARHYWSSVTK